MSVDSLRRDLISGWRAHRRTPIVTAIVVATLSLGIAATSVAFSLVNGVFLRPPPFQNPERFVRVYHHTGTSAQYLPISYPEFDDIRKLEHVFDGALVEEPVPLALRIDDSSERVFGEVVSDGYFRLLGIRPALGRWPSDEEDRTGETLVIISNGLWKRRFGGVANAIGRDVRIDGRPYRVIGVAPPGFGGTILGFSSDLWIPLASSPEWRGMRTERSNRGLFAMARLAPDVEISRARVAVDILATRLQRDYPASNSGVRFATFAESEGRILPTFRNEAIGASALVLICAFLVIAIVCANVAGVLLVRSEARRPEIGVRLAVGASRARIVVQLLTESAMLSLAAGGLGLALAWQATRLVSATQVTLARGAAVGLDIGMDWRVLAVSVGVTALTTVLVGLAPALETSRQNLLAVLRKSAPPGEQRSWSRWTFLSAQIAVSMVILACSGLFLRSLQHAREADLGFDPVNVVTTAADIRASAASPVDRRRFWTRLIEAIRRMPQTESASLTYRPPLELGMVVASVGPDGFTPARGQAWPRTEYCAIEPDYFQTLRIPFVEGRDFTANDIESASQVVILNDVLARQFWPDEPAVGKHIVTPDGTRSEVVGVVRRSNYLFVGEAPKPYLYVPQNGGAEAMTIVARGSGDPAGYLQAIATIILSHEPSAALFDVGALSARVDKALAPTTGAASSLGFIGLMALGLTALGLFGAVAQSVGRRTFEIGVRRALGARDIDVIRLVGGETLVLIVGGLAVGSIAALGASRALQSWLYDVNPADPMVFGLAPTVLIIVCLAAAWLPVRRALHLSASSALRHE
jgi:macrolide transport system ATP-binding/permease protein